MTGPVALHGGGEFQAGDEAFLAALLDAWRTGRVGGGGRPIRVVDRPDRGRARIGRTWRPRTASRRSTRGRDASGLEVEVTAVAVVSHATAADPALAVELAAADVIHFPGGDPDLIPTIMPGSAAWAAITEAHAAGAVLAGASAGAMALGSWTWTPGGGMGGLTVVHGIVVVPHAKEATWDADHRAVRGVGARGPRCPRPGRADRRHRGARRPRERDHQLARRRSGRGPLAAATVAAARRSWLDRAR